jgi:methylated-DNA-protein-cysteine methyltransferase-like protein
MAATNHDRGDEAVRLGTSHVHAYAVGVATLAEITMPRPKRPVNDLLRPLSHPANRSRRAAAPEENPAVLAICHIIASIPKGRVSTYGGVARAAGYPGRARLTAYALRTVSSDMRLPWYRVLGAGGRIVFPKNSSSHREQARLLRGEGVPVALGRVPRPLICDEEI